MDAFVKRTLRAEKVLCEAQEALSCGRTSEQPPPKRLKREQVQREQDMGSVLLAIDGNSSPKEQRVDDGPDDVSQRQLDRTTDVENVLAPTQVDDDAIREYEDMKSSQLGAGASEAAEQGWLPAKSSIYLDAFNLALDTVLENESQLFNNQELEVFRQWRMLDYQAQYLYVRLFLRKTAAWHRTSRLKYYADVTDPEAAVESLQQARPNPQSGQFKAPDDMGELGLQEPIEEEWFAFVDTSRDKIQTVDEALPLLLLDELKILAKDAKVQGCSKNEMIKALCVASQQQVDLMALSLGRHDTRRQAYGVSGDNTQDSSKDSSRSKIGRQNRTQEQRLLERTLGILGPCIRVSPFTLKLFERVHLVFYRSTEWTEKSLTTIILARISRRTFADYIVCRTSTIFASRMHLVEFEAAIRLEGQVDGILEFNGTPSEADLQEILDIHQRVYPRWQKLVAEEHVKEQSVYEMGEGAYLRRFNPAHPYTRIIHKALTVLGRRKEHKWEHDLLEELLGQRLFHLARRGAWYQRKALVEEHYMSQVDDGSGDVEQRKKWWRRRAASTCEDGLQDPDCHLVYHYDLQKRLVKLERKLRIPRRLQHDFGHVRLADPEQMTVAGTQVKREQASSTKTIWLDEQDSGGECSVEEMCLGRFRSRGWKGYHAEGGILRTLFAYLFYDILFLYVPNVFQTAYQTCPLDLFTDAFFPARASEINHRLVAIANGEAEGLLRGVWEREQAKRTSVVGLDWDFDVEDLAELVRCFKGSALATVCKVMAQEYRQRGGGVPDLVLWRQGQKPGAQGGGGEEGGGEEDGGEEDEGEREKGRSQVMFAEVKSANDKLSDTQRLWIHVLAGAGVKVVVCNAVASEVRHIG